MTTQLERRQRLFELVAMQGGYFTAAQAREIGYDSRTVWHHVKTGRLERASRGFYRLAGFPAHSHEDVIAAWVKAGPGRAVVSHETALALYDLAPIRQRGIHLTVQREHRPYKGQARLPGIQVHTTSRPFDAGEVVQRFGVKVTSPARSIADAAEAGTDPSAIREVIGRALQQGLLTERDLREAVQGRPKRVRDLVALPRVYSPADKRGETGVIHLIRSRASRQQVVEMQETLETYIKLAVDIRREILAGGGIMHADCEAMLLQDGSQQHDVWGADWDPGAQVLTFEALINIRPRQDNPSMEILASDIRDEVSRVVHKLLGGI
jgi:predicted transcriptional regulator of viral defense system